MASLSVTWGSGTTACRRLTMLGIQMQPKVQETLASALQYVREMKSQRVADVTPYMAHADGVIAGLENAGILDGSEASVWRRKLYAIVEQPTRRAGKRPRPAHRTQTPNLGFIKLIPGPTEPEPFLDGFMRIVAVELLEDRVRVHWNLHPLPSYAALLGDDLAELDADTAGLAEDDRAHQRLTARYTRLHHLLRFNASDDRGTEYRFSRGGSTGDNERGEERGIADFKPAARGDADSISIRVHETKFTIPLG